MAEPTLDERLGGVFAIAVVVDQAGAEYTYRPLEPLPARVLDCYRCVSPTWGVASM